MAYFEISEFESSTVHDAVKMLFLFRPSKRVHCSWYSWADYIRTFNGGQWVNGMAIRSCLWNTALRILQKESNCGIVVFDIWPINNHFNVHHRHTSVLFYCRKSWKHAHRRNTNLRCTHHSISSQRLFLGLRIFLLQATLEKIEEFPQEEGLTSLLTRLNYLSE